MKKPMITMMRSKGLLKETYSEPSYKETIK